MVPDQLVFRFVLHSDYNASTGRFHCTNPVIFVNDIDLLLLGALIERVDPRNLLNFACSP
jgi:hypothetical protein